MRPSALALLAPALLLAPTALRAQASAPAKPAASAPAALPAGWAARLDRDGAASAMSFVKMGTGYHATTGPAAIFYESSRTAQGSYTAEATFTQTKAPMHPEAYGLILGAKQLDAATQNYLYFVVRGDGKYLLKHRAGAEVHTLQDWTASPALKVADAAGKATNALRVRVGADSTRFDVNGTQVHAIATSASLTDGIVGLRINHQLDVHVDGFAVTPKAR